MSFGRGLTNSFKSRSDNYQGLSRKNFILRHDNIYIAFAYHIAILYFCIHKYTIMKIQTALRFDEDLLKLIKEKAKAQRRSLNNYIENLLYKEIGNIPNDETIEAINEAHNSKNLKPIKDLDTFLETL